MRLWTASIFALYLLSTASVSSAEEPTPFVAGLQPDRRPSHAPAIVAHVPAADWPGRAVRGIEPPANGTAFLKDQGAWYTPFDRPGMNGRYDIRGLHRAPAAGD